MPCSARGFRGFSQRAQSICGPAGGTMADRRPTAAQAFGARTRAGAEKDTSKICGNNGATGLSIEGGGGGRLPQKGLN